MKQSGTFENFDRKEKVKIASERSFGVIFSILFFTLAVLAWRRQSAILPIYITAGSVTLALTLIAPFILRPLNLAWGRLGLLLHKVMTPVIMALMFFVVFLPLGFALTFFKKLSLQKSFDKELKTYWISRPESSPTPASMKNSF